MPRSDDEDSTMYGDQDEENSVSQVSDDDEGEDIGYNRRSGKSNRIQDSEDDDDDDDEEEEEEDEEEARKVSSTRFCSLPLSLLTRFFLIGSRRFYCRRRRRI